MLSGRGNQTFALALGLSLALHVALLLAAPNPAGWGGPPERRSVVAVRLTSPTVAPPATQPEEPELEKTREIELGLDAPNPPSRTWLGFREYLKQLAAKSEIEQAAFTDDPVAAAPAAPPSPPAPAPQPPSPALAQATPQPTDSTEPPQESDTPPQPQPAAAEAPTEPTRAIEQPQKNDEAPKAETDAAPEEQSDSTSASEPAPALDGLAIETSDANADTPAIEEPTGSFLAPLTALIEQAREAAKQAAARSNPPPPPTAAAQSAPPRPMIARQPTQGDPSLGAQSDRESDPSSVIDVPREQWQLGKPLAAQGLEIKPRRPEMTILTTLTAWPRNPVCRVSFDRDGVPVKAVLVQATGDSRVDAAIEASLYRWRASGKELEALKDDQTVDLTIRLLINPKRRSEDKDEPA